MKILFVSAYMPHRDVAHAGGRTHYHYVSEFARDPSNEVSVVGFAEPGGAPNSDDEPFRSTTLFYPHGGMDRLLHKSWRAWLRINPRARRGGVVPPRQERRLMCELNRMAQAGYGPDVIVLEWSQMALLAGDVRSLFPRTKIVASLHDCLFQWAARTAMDARRGWARLVWEARARYIRRIEIAALHATDLVLVQSIKDQGMLAAAGIDPARVHVIAPRFQLPLSAPNRQPKLEVVFFGAMDRVENYSACIWFIDEVMPLLRVEVPGIKFVAVGAKPHPSLQSRAARDVEVTGFVQSVSPYFERALCLVAPLRLGAGIKVKVLEGMAAGLPVLTNGVGIEGIPATAGTHYLACESASDYVSAIQRIIRDRDTSRAMGDAARELVLEAFDLEKSTARLKSRLMHLGKARAA